MTQCPDCKGKGYIELFMTSQPCDCRRVKEQKEKLERIQHKGWHEWLLDGKRHSPVTGKNPHRIPAYETDSGTKVWYQHGKIHRIGGPAIIWINGTTNWYHNGKLHKEDGPAIEYPSGNKAWYINGEFLTEEEHSKRRILKNYLRFGFTKLTLPIIKNVKW